MFPLPTDEALAIASILAVSAVADSCAPMSTGSLQKRGVYDWGSVVNSANDLWPAVEPGGELQLIRTVVDMQLPPLLIVVQVTLQQVVAAGAQIAGMALSAGGLGIVAAVLFFIALDLKYCLNPNPNTFVIPTEAIANSAASISQASGTTLDCPPPTAAPDCSK